MRALIYVRQSVDHAEGIDRQLTRCRALCDRQGWDVAHEFVDNAVSATKARGKGTAWAEMVATLEDGDVVVAVDVDRIMRSTADLLTLQEAGARIRTLDGEIDTAGADGEFRATMLTAIARFETRRKQERQLRANESRAEHGRPVPSRRRYGYDTDGCTPREAEAQVVRRIYTDAAEGRTLRSIVKWLEAEGVDPAPGRGWNNNRVRYILQSPFYVGRAVHRGVVTESEHITPLVPVAQWERVQAILSAAGRRTSPGPVAVNLASGLVVCTACGSTHKKMGRGYTCARGHNSILQSVVDPLVRALVVMVATSFALPADEGVTSTATLAALNDALTANDAEASAVAADRADGLLSPAAARERLVALRDARQGLEARLEAARAATGDLLTWAADARALSDAGDDAAATFDALPLDVQRAVIRGVLEMRVHPGRDPWRFEFRERGGVRWNRARMVDGALSWSVTPAV